MEEGEASVSYGTLTTGYSAIAKLLHWLVAMGVLVTIPVGITMVWWEGSWQDNLYIFHKSLGVTILTLMALRLGYRLWHGAPAAESTLKPWERVVSGMLHGILYAMLIATPIVGWAANSAYGASIPFFWLIEVPPLLAKNEPLSDQLFLLHRLMGFTVGALVLLHIGAALRHYFVQRDGVLQRMLPKALGGA